MRTHWFMAAFAGLLLAAGDAAAQQSYPNKSIRLIVPFPPGGVPDIVARTLAQKLTDTFNQTVLVDNRPGAAGTIAIETAVRAQPDGYTVVMVTSAYAGNAAVYRLPYDPVNDVLPIALVGESAYMMTMHPSVPVTTVKELIVFAAANPGKLDYGSAGTGTINHLAVELFNQMATTKMTHVPYKGIVLALNDLLGARLQLVVGGVAPSIPHVRSNRLRGIAVTTPERSNAVPDIPAVGETLPGYEAVQRLTVLGPKALPKDIAARWSNEIDRIVQLPEVKDRMAGDGIERAGGSPERFREVLARDIAKWQKVVKIANIKPGS